jgi:hypothetical protein
MSSPIANQIATLADNVLVAAAASMAPDVLANAIRLAAANDADQANAMVPPIFGALSDANSGGSPRVAPTPAITRGRPVATPVKVEPTVTPKATRGPRKAAGKASSGEAPGKGQKRSPDVLVTLMDGIEAYVLANPGCSAEEFAKHLGQKTPKLAPLVRKLVDANKITKTGEKRGTRYHAPVSADSDNDYDADAAE